MIDADIYLDVDGVLFTVENGIFELRHGFIGFLKFLTDNFQNCYWLTCWNDGFNDVLKKVYAGSISQKFKWADWRKYDNKAMAINYTRDFVWIEDGICDNEMEVLKEKNCVNKYLYVSPEGEMDKLYIIKDELKQRFKII
jgi:hypothetical protein